VLMGVALWTLGESLTQPHPTPPGPVLTRCERRGRGTVRPG
jgi:hypothetical protein